MEETRVPLRACDPVKLNPSFLSPRIGGSSLLILATVLSAGCTLFPETRRRDVLHNPFPQLKRVAVLPFFNQSESPTLDGDAVGSAYYAALQAVPGFEVLPIGVARMQWNRYVREIGEPRSGADFQRLARFMDVEAVVVGSVTDYEAYYPPRMAMTVHWYAANDGFHTIPPGYGLPWGTEAEDQIPQRIVREAEFELARSQLATQTPVAGEAALAPDGVDGGISPDAMSGSQAAYHESLPIDGRDAIEFTQAAGMPDPTDLIPDPPSPVPPVAQVTHEPVLTQTRIYRGDDAYFTDRLSDYVETNDDARGSGWQGYLYRTDDFVRFCCHLHVNEMLESRGGAQQSDLILRWPLSRY